MISIIIPANNEETVIARCLEAFKEGIEDKTLEVVIVCNGCTDNTALVARKFHPEIKVVETQLKSKSAALNMGDQIAKYFPRIYLDADIILPKKSIDAIAKTLNKTEVLSAAPKIKVNLKKVSIFVKAFYYVWLNLPYFSEGMLGCGVYALSKDGRKRFDKFPDIINDDEYVRVQYSKDERVTIDNAYFISFPPKNLKNLIHIRIRDCYGYYQFNELYPDLKVRKKKNFIPFLVKFIFNPLLWISLPVYIFVKFNVMFTAKYNYYAKKKQEWNKDSSSR